MEFTCCKCEDKYVADISGDADERLCYICLDEIIEEFGEEDDE